jgi:hypothetical protein
MMWRCRRCGGGCGFPQIVPGHGQAVEAGQEQSGQDPILEMVGEDL